MRLGNLDPALQWVADNNAQLAESSGEAAASLFNFKLHRLHFLDILNTQGQPPNPFEWSHPHSL